ncbi:MAG TPA: BatA domain-containing protein, partial [Thermoanaerobaculia bacterium]|nr:BatA domain-containing protein [Thermoanaerobaculia bacterium]
MVPFLTSPLALIALIGVPALIAIYLFQRRFKTLEVSSLILWDAVKQPSMGGRKRERLHLPLPFWLEALAVVLLALAAAGPFLARWTRARPLAIVCDDSLSMRGGARDRALAFVNAELKRRKYAPVRIIFAGQTPQLGELAQWSCSAPSADLDAATAMAAQAAGPSGLVLVLTDHAPERPLEEGKIRWHSFGERAANLGFVAATRSGDRALVEIANYGDKPATAHGRTIAPGTRQRLELKVPGNAPFEMDLPADGAEFDNHITLLPDQAKPLAVAVRMKDRALVEPALLATKRVIL